MHWAFQVLGGICACFLILYLFSLEVFLQSSHPATKPFTAEPLPDHELQRTHYDLETSWTYNLPPPDPNTVHVVIGGSGSLGSAVCRILMERKERLRIVDLVVSVQ